MEDILTSPAGGHGPPSTSREPLGESLVRAGLLSREQLEAALETQRYTATPLGRILMANGWVRPLDFYRHLAAHLGLPFVNLVENPPDASLFDLELYPEYARLLFLPWMKSAECLTVAVAEPDQPLLEALRQRYGRSVRFVVTSRLDVLWTIQRLAQQELTVDSVFGRAQADPEHCAMQILTRPQSWALALAAVAAAALLWWHPSASLAAANFVLCLLLLGSLLLRVLLVWTGSGTLYRASSTAEEVQSLDARDLPTYTILVPLYRDAAVVPILARALRSLDYPKSKLDIKLILEGDDPGTIEACKKAGLEGCVELIVVPPSQPRTKPKALNYAMAFARGQYLTIYDAEDVPEPDQLKKAVLAFRKAPWDVVCFQARLNYFNWHENWLTRMFCLEYSLWFDWYLPGLEALGIPIPLGGTSNHFRAEVVRAVGGWDPFNVTEDADLGVRFTMSGWRVGVLDSTTYEEANGHLWNWIRQRSRWVKGYLQTWLVYMRHPLRSWRRLGWRGFLGFHGFIGGSFLGPLAFPPLACLYLAWLVTRSALFDPLFPPPVLAMSLLLLAGNGLLIYFHMLAAWVRKLPVLVFFATHLPAYYLLMSAAAWRALWQLVTRPHYWEKTEHGLTRVSAYDGENLSPVCQVPGA